MKTIHFGILVFVRDGNETTIMARAEVDVLEVVFAPGPDQPLAVVKLGESIAKIAGQIIIQAAPAVRAELKGDG